MFEERDIKLSSLCAVQIFQHKFSQFLYLLKHLLSTDKMSPSSCISHKYAVLAVYFETVTWKCLKVLKKWDCNNCFPQSFSSQFSDFQTVSLRKCVEIWHSFSKQSISVSHTLAKHPNSILDVFHVASLIMKYVWWLSLVYYIGKFLSYSLLLYTVVILRGNFPF